MDLFEALGWVACLITSAILFYIYAKKRYLIVKPSIVFITIFHVCIQWAATIDYQNIVHTLPDPSDFLLLTHLFPLAVVTISQQFGDHKAREVWDRLISTTAFDPAKYRAIAVILTGSMVIAVMIYLYYVPFWQTGLYAIFMNPMGAAQAREESLKLIDNLSVKYLYLFMASAIAPLLTVIFTRLMTSAWRSGAYLQVVFYMLSIPVIAFAAALTGARGFVANIILTMIMTILFERGLPLNPVKLLGYGLLVVSGPVILSIMREGQALSLTNFWEYLSNGVGGRIFYTPMQTGLWFADYAQTSGFLGVAGIPKIASFFGVDSVNASNLVGLRYTHSSLDSMLANTCFLFSYYCFFGFNSLWISVLLTLCLDSVTWLYAKFSDLLLLPCIVAIFVSSLSFADSDYTTVLITHGFLPILALSAFLGKFVESRRGRQVTRSLEHLSPPVGPLGT